MKLKKTSYTIELVVACYHNRSAGKMTIANNSKDRLITIYFTEANANGTDCNFTINSLDEN
jgi:hypothetical protein